MRKVIDITDLTVWHGNLSGIQRVVYEMAVRYAANPEVEFCYFVEQDERFYRLGNVQKLLNPDPHTPNSQDAATRMSHMRHIKRAIRALTPPVVHKAQQHGVAKLRAQRAKAIQQENHPIQPGDQPFEFTAEDVLVVFGAHWDKPHYIPTITHLKAKIGIKIVHNINDFIPVYDKAHTAEVEHERFPRYMNAVCELSDAITFISEATARDYARFLKDYKIKNRAKTGVIILGEDIAEKETAKPAHITASRFILNVGTVEVRKNPVLLYQVYRLAAERGIELPMLYIVGRPGWLTGDVCYQITHDPKVEGKIVMCHDIDDKGLSWMYENCEFFIFPSYYEGWGLPVAEAAHHGKASIASNSSSIPEVIGNCAEYFSPDSADECLDAIVRMCDPTHRARYEQLLSKRKPHTWDKTYRDAENIISQII